MANYALGNIVDKSYLLMTLCPIRNGNPGYGPSFQARIREYLAQLPNGDKSPFNRIPTLHLCRFVIVPDMPNQGFPSEEDHLNSAYLLISASIAGSWIDCFETMLKTMREEVRSIFENCVGFPGTGDPTAFTAYIKSCQIDSAFSFGAYTHATVHDVHRALHVQSELRKFIEQHQGTKPGDLQQKFKQLMHGLET